MIGRSGERGSGIFVLAARHDDDDDDDDELLLRTVVYDFFLPLLISYQVALLICSPIIFISILGQLNWSL